MLVINYCVSKATQRLKKLRVVIGHQQVFRTDFEHGFGFEPQEELLGQFEAQLEDIDVVVFSDYAKVTLSQVHQMIVLAKERAVKVIVDPKGADYSRCRGSDSVTPNTHEFFEEVSQCQSDAQMTEKAKQLMSEHELTSLLLARGADGMRLYRLNQIHVDVQSLPKVLFDITGAVFLFYLICILVVCNFLYFIFFIMSVCTIQVS